MSPIRSIRGMRDLLPEESETWARIEKVVYDTVGSFGYREIRLPLVETTALFQRSVGDTTDIVEKEMYSFESREGESLTLRPEGTAGCVRAALQHGLAFNRISRLWYRGPMFRYERPQKGRYRQFEQTGVEAFGIASPALDAELIEINCRYLQALGLSEQVGLRINSLGTPVSRHLYVERLKAYLESRREDLDADSIRRLERNPLRVLDSKDASTQMVVAEAPGIEECLDDDSRRHFQWVLELLDASAIDYQIDRGLVRGLDYYTHTVFEFETQMLGAQGAISGGGRYDGLVESLGGRPTPAAGFALGMDRLVLLYRGVHGDASESLPQIIYCVAVDAESLSYLMRCANRLRAQLKGWQVILDTAGGKLATQMRRADREGATWAVIAGETERTSSTLTLKPMREVGEQQCLTYDALVARLCESDAGNQQIGQQINNKVES